MSFIFSGLSKTSNETMELENAENGVLEHSISPLDHKIFFIDSSSGHMYMSHLHISYGSCEVIISHDMVNLF